MLANLVSARAAIHVERIGRWLTIDIVGMFQSEYDNVLLCHPTKCRNVGLTLDGASRLEPVKFLAR
jgi:hypothetical protein